MNFFKWIRNSFSPTADKQGWQNGSPMVSAVPSATNVSPEQALQVSTVYACVELLSRTMASLPCDVYLVNSNGSREKDTLCNLHQILSESPNYNMTPFEFIQTLVLNWALRGNAYALISRKTDKTVKAIYPLNSEQMQVFMDDKGDITYRYYSKNDKYADYKPKDILHWKCMGNGIIGISKLEYMTASVDESIKAQTTAIDVFANKGKIRGILTAENNLNPKQKEEIAQQFNAARIRDGNPVLPANIKFQSLSLSPAEQQLLQIREFSVEEICRWYGVPSALINSDGGAPGSNLEQVTANFYKSTILPMCISLEQAIMKRLPCQEEKYNHQVSFRLSFLNRASDQTRSQINAQAVQNGWKTRNEVRIEEGLPPVENGDALTAQNNLQPLSLLGTSNASQTPQTPISTQPIKQ